MVWGFLWLEDFKDWFEYEYDFVLFIFYERDKYIWGVGEEFDFIILLFIFDFEGIFWKLVSDIMGYNI